MAITRVKATRKQTTPKIKRTVTRKVVRESPEKYIVDARGNRVAVVLDLAEYRRLVENKHATSRITGYDWLAEARRVRALAHPSQDSTPILRDLREGRLR